MSKEAARILLSNRFDIVWQAVTNPLRTMKIERENTKFDQPKGATWGRYSLAIGDSIALSPGTDDERTVFVAYLQVFIPEEKGTADANKAADALRPMKKQVLRFSDAAGETVVHIRPPSLNTAPTIGGFKAFNVTMTGYFDYYPSQA